MRKLLVLSFVFAVCVSMSPLAVAATATMIDDFSADPASSEWTTKCVLFDGTTPATMDAANANDNLHISTATSQLCQTTFLRDDYTLGIGQTLIADLVNIDWGVQGAGIVVASSDAPDIPGSTNDRVNMLVCAIWPNTNAGFYRSDVFLFDENGGCIEEYEGIPDYKMPDMLFIAREDADTYHTGWIIDGIGYKNATLVNGVDANFDFDGAVGFFADIRTAGKTAEFDNLRLYNAVIPEPGSIALVLTGLAGMLFVWKRRK